MTAKDEEPVHLYAPLPPDPDHQTYVVLPLYPSRRRHHLLSNRYRSLRCCLFASGGILLLVAAFFLLYPADPDLTLVRLHLNSIKVRTYPHLSLDLSLALTLRVRNRDFFSLNYSSIVVSIGYRGRELGSVTSDGGFVGARGSSYVNATLVLNAFEVIHDAFYLVEDLARGLIPFDTESELKGTVELLFLQVPIEGKISCEVYVSTTDQTIVSQDCYPA